MFASECCSDSITMCLGGLYRDCLFFWTILKEDLTIESVNMNEKCQSIIEFLSLFCSKVFTVLISKLG